MLPASKPSQSAVDGITLMGWSVNSVCLCTNVTGRGTRLGYGYNGSETACPKISLYDWGFSFLFPFFTFLTWLSRLLGGGGGGQAGNQPLKQTTTQDERAAHADSAGIQDVMCIIVEVANAPSTDNIRRFLSGTGGGPG